MKSSKKIISSDLTVVAKTTSDKLINKFFILQHKHFTYVIIVPQKIGNYFFNFRIILESCCEKTDTSCYCSYYNKKYTWQVNIEFHTKFSLLCFDWNWFCWRKVLGNSRVFHWSKWNSVPSKELNRVPLKECSIPFYVNLLHAFPCFCNYRVGRLMKVGYISSPSRLIFNIYNK